MLSKSKVCLIILLVGFVNAEESSFINGNIKEILEDAQISKLKQPVNLN